jgi:ClpP class serine protease
MSEMSGGTSVQRFKQSLEAALADDKVTSIMLDIDSPGGSTDLIPEMAAQIRQARKQKPIVAMANTAAASAAYWLGSQASEFVVSPSGKVGSIGVFAAHTDVSEAEAKAGVKTTLISAGKFKTEMSPFSRCRTMREGGDPVEGRQVLFDVRAGRRSWPRHDCGRCP